MPPLRRSLRAAGEPSIEGSAKVSQDPSSRGHQGDPKQAAEALRIARRPLALRASLVGQPALELGAAAARIAALAKAGISGGSPERACFTDQPPLEAGRTVGDTQARRRPLPKGPAQTSQLAREGHAWPTSCLKSTLQPYLNPLRGNGRRAVDVRIATFPVAIPPGRSSRAKGMRIVMINLARSISRALPGALPTDRAPHAGRSSWH